MDLPKSSASELCAAKFLPRDYRIPPILGDGKGSGFADMITKLVHFDVVFLGERHDRVDHHANQLEILCRLHRRRPDLVIGIEYLPVGVQPVLDAYIGQELNEPEMLLQSEYFDRWRFDFRLYSGLFRFARANSIPLVALNLPSELTRQVAARGIAQLAKNQREQLPEMDYSDRVYEQHLREVFAGHPQSEGRQFHNFHEAQLLWDEGMAESASAYLEAHPGRRMVVLAGSGHIAYGRGIPNRLRRRIGKPFASVLTRAMAGGEIVPAAADWVLELQDLRLEPSPKIGVLLDLQPGEVNVLKVVEGSGAKAAGLSKGDTIMSIGDRAIRRFADVRLALWGKSAGDSVRITVRRATAAQPISFKVTLR